MRRISLALLSGAFVWTLVHTLDVVIGVRAGYGRWLRSNLSRRLHERAIMVTVVS